METPPLGEKIHFLTGAMTGSKGGVVRLLQ